MKTKNKFARLISAFIAVIMVFGIAPMSFCVEVDAADYKVGDIIEFGSYPQSEVTDAKLLAQLNNLEKEWISYNYYSGEDSLDTIKCGDWMQYADVTLNGEKYRAVTFSKYRPSMTYKVASSEYISYQYQGLNGYHVNDVYWFKFEPVEWVVLDPVNNLLLCADIIDSQPFNSVIYVNENTDGMHSWFIDNNYMYYANDYSVSEIRNWLNDNFYKTAFSSNEQKQIIDRTCVNTSYPYSEEFCCETTSDKVFLLSHDEVMNSVYGFSSDKYEDVSRLAKGTDYAKCQGLLVPSYNVGFGNSWWWIRSAYPWSSSSCSINYEGLVHYSNVHNTNMGVRPAITLDSLEHMHSFKLSQTINATCTKAGSKIYTCSCGNTYTEKISATGHKYNSGIVTKVPTCSAEGIKTFTCSSCGDTYTEKIAKKEHVIKTIGSDATCTTDGFSYSVCANCGITLGAPVLVPATGHKTGEWVVTKAPQCAVDGKEELRCTECNELLDSRVITSPGHVYNNGVITKASTCTEDGIKTFTCNCGDSYTEIIPAKGHIAGEWETILEPTTKTDGKKIKKCTICSSTIEEEIIEKLLVVTDTETGIAFEYSGENYTGEVGIIVKETFDGSAFNIINTNLNPSQNKIFDIKMTVDGVVTQPNGEIVVRIPIPKGYDPANTFLYHVDTKTGVVEHVPANVINNHLVFNTTHFSYYAIIELINITLNKISFEQDNYIVNYKDSLKVVATPNMETGKKINYVIGDSTVATIDDEGNITTVGPGTATVVATIEGTDISDTCTITVSYTWWQWIIVIVLFGWLWY